MCDRTTFARKFDISMCVGHNRAKFKSAITTQCRSRWRGSECGARTKRGVHFCMRVHCEWMKRGTQDNGPFISALDCRKLVVNLPAGFIVRGTNLSANKSAEKVAEAKSAPVDGRAIAAYGRRRRLCHAHARALSRFMSHNFFLFFFSCLFSVPVQVNDDEACVHAA